MSRLMAATSPKGTTEINTPQRAGDLPTSNDCLETRWRRITGAGTANRRRWASMKRMARGIRAAQIASRPATYEMAVGVDVPAAKVQLAGAPDGNCCNRRLEVLTRQRIAKGHNAIVVTSTMGHCVRPHNGAQAQRPVDGSTAPFTGFPTAFAGRKLMALDGCAGRS